MYIFEKNKETKKLKNENLFKKCIILFSCADLTYGIALVKKKQKKTFLDYLGQNLVK